MLLAQLAVLIALGCGDERWDVKVLGDGFNARTADHYKTTLEWMTKQKPPFKEWSPKLKRTAHEKYIYTVDAAIVGYKLETDGDFHVVLSDGVRTMVVEIPDPQCGYNYDTNVARMQFLALVPKAPTKAYRKLQAPLPVTVVGVPFWDKPHGQLGGAPNGFELHPVLSFTKREASK